LHGLELLQLLRAKLGPGRAAPLMLFFGEQKLRMGSTLKETKGTSTIFAGRNGGDEDKDDDGDDCDVLRSMKPAHASP